MAYGESQASELRFCVARGGVEPPTFRFSVGRSYQLSYLAGHLHGDRAGTRSSMEERPRRDSNPRPPP